MFECKMSLQYVPDFGRFVFAQGSGPDSPKFYTSCSYEVRASSLISPHSTLTRLRTHRLFACPGCGAARLSRVRNKHTAALVVGHCVPLLYELGVCVCVCLLVTASASSVAH